MWDWIEKNRKKSRKERSRLTFIMSSILTGVIALVWGTVVLPRTFTLNDRSESRANASTPFKVLTENLGVIIDDARSGFGAVQDTFGRGFRGEDEASQDDVIDLDSSLSEMGSRGEVGPFSEEDEFLLEESGNAEVGDDASRDGVGVEIVEAVEAP